MDTNPEKLNHNAFPFEFGILEIQQDPNSKFGDLEVVDHLAALQIGYISVHSWFAPSSFPSFASVKSPFPSVLF
jgi:hypothetical protein